MENAMPSFVEANQAKLSLKMHLSNYSWYKSIAVVQDGLDWCLQVKVNKSDDSIRKIVPAVHKNILVKIDIDNR